MALSAWVASDAAFGVVFGVFVAALAVLAFVAVRWGVRRDRPGREAWRRRHLGAAPWNGPTSPGRGGPPGPDDGR